MPLFGRKNRKLTSDESTGFGAHSKDNSGRFYTKSGIPNVVKTGYKKFEHISVYHSLIRMPLGKFFLLVFAFYVAINLIFTIVYTVIGIDHLAGVNRGTAIDDFLEMFFFSTQTFSTVGYGRISPVGHLTSFVATFEAFIGLLSFAIATGLFFARFSKPVSYIKFSKNALVAPFKDGKALMFRMASYKNNVLTDLEVRLLLAVKELENGELVNKFYTLDTTVSKINLLSLSWTVVHPINDASPLFGFDEAEIENTPMEVMVFVKGYDEVYSNNVITRTSYINTEMVWNAKFKIMYRADEAKNTTVVDFKLLDAYEKL
jgi:inward rectifier potassium channel